MQLGFRPDDRHRTVTQNRLIDMLLLSACPFDVADGQGSYAVTQMTESLAIWVDAGLGYCVGDDGARRFDPVEAFNVMKWLGVHGRDTFWADQFVATSRALALTPGLTETPTEYSMTIRRRFGATCVPGTKLRLRLPLPLEGMYTNNLVVTPVVAPSLMADITYRAGHMEVRLLAPPDAEVEIGAHLAFTGAQPKHPPLTPSERELYLRPVEGFIRITPDIDTLAARLAGNRLAPRQVVARFWDYILDELLCGMVHYDVVPADKAVDWVLHNRWFDCQLGSALLVSLCRARGIPARLLGGNLLYPLSPTNHFWAELWLDEDGWRPFDLLSWDLSYGGREESWRHFYFATVDTRTTTQCFPLSPTGPIGVRMPASWHMLQTIADTGVVLDFVDYNSSLIYGDSVYVTLLKPPTTD